nr:MAG TPA_asm: hypothetical protein [Caudoviricetes sp.]
MRTTINSPLFCYYSRLSRIPVYEVGEAAW